MSKEAEARVIAEAIKALDSTELTRRILDELDADAFHALRQLVHPNTGEQLSLSGVSVANPPRHETGRLSGGD